MTLWPGLTINHVVTKVSSSVNLLKCLSPAFTPGPLPQVFHSAFGWLLWCSMKQLYPAQLILSPIPFQLCLSTCPPSSLSLLLCLLEGTWSFFTCCCRKLHLAELTCHISVTPPYLPSSYVSQPTTTTHGQKSCQSSHGQDDIWAIHICICWCFPLVLSTCLITRIWTPMGNFQDLHIIILTHTMTSECLIIHAIYMLYTF